jgi:hypothetical protein
MEGSFLPLFMGTDGSGPYTVEGAPANGPLPVQLVGGPGVLDVQITGPLPVPVEIAGAAGALAVTLPAAAATYTALLFGAYVAVGGNTVALQLRGSPSKKVNILRVAAQMTATTAALIPMSVIKCSAAAVGGVGVAGAMYNNDSSFPPPTAVSTTFSGGLANISTILGQYGAVLVQSVISPTQPTQYLFTAPPGGQAVTLNNANEYLLISMGNTGAGNQNFLLVEWSEQ